MLYKLQRQLAQQHVGNKTANAGVIDSIKQVGVQVCNQIAFKLVPIAMMRFFLQLRQY